jgi:tetratricopeptide (TPR) repeat protein
MEHLFSLCPVCLREYRAWVEEREGPHAYDRAFRPLPLPHAQMTPVPERREEPEDPKQAERDFKELRDLSVDECERKIERSRSRFRGRLLVELLIAQSDRYMPENPREAFRFAELGQLVAFRSMPSAFEAGVRAAARMANAKRASGFLEQADSLIRFARFVAASQGLTSSLMSAELDRYEGTLRIDQRQFVEAENLLSRAQKLYEILKDSRRVAHMELALTTLYYYRGDLPLAISRGELLLDSLNRESDPTLYLCAENNLALYLCDSGEYEHALFILDNDPEFSIRFGDRHTNVRRLWVTGRAAAGLGDFAGAEEALRAVQNVFVEDEIGYDAALASLDLAVVFARTGRVRDLKKTAEQILPILRANCLHQEVAVALRLFVEAVREEEVSLAFVEEVTAFMRQAKLDPTLTFRGRKDVN